ncbi:MAG: hypothetical protein JM58_01165 [Peptococcaceae bacterium BICA1-8]|nr:MAG: hypothetical protein JM58_01165 [Peptococcaceae bacterium BICA1-8]
MSRKLRRALLFVPGSSPAMIRTSSIIDADSLIFDLEDAVAPSEKESSRFLLQKAFEALTFGNKEIIVRINPLYSPWGYDDLKLVSKIPNVNTILIPKATTEAVLEVDKALKGTNKEMICIIETACALEKAYEIATSSDRVNGLFLGAEDLAADMNFERTVEGEEIQFARFTVARAAYAAKVQPIDTPYITIDDLAGLRVDTLKSKSMGYAAKASISPLHIPVIKEIFTPSAEEIANAKRIIKAAEEADKKGLGAVQLDGKMIDLPIVLRAQKILDLCGEVDGNDH